MSGYGSQVDYSKVTEHSDRLAPLLGVVAMVAAITLTTVGGCYGTAKSAAGLGALCKHHPDLLMKGIIPVVMAGVIAIYGLIVAIVIMQDLGKGGAVGSGERFHKACRQFCGGLSVGVCGLFSGVGIGVVGDAGLRGSALRPQLFLTTVIALIFCEALAIYGLIIAVVVIVNQ